MTVRDAARTRLGRFELQRELGRGAQGSVWLAHDPRLQRDVALKLLAPARNDAGGADPASRTRDWLDEARAVGRLAHPNVVPLFEADLHEGRPYLVFEFVDGPTLAALRRQRPQWPAREAVELMIGVLDALAAAHDQGLVHRDLKPSNVLIGADGRPRVMDFGIAAHVAGDSDGRIVGTPGYISPEAARGQAPVPAMDVFAAGALLAELLAGAPLLREIDPLRALHRVMAEDLRLTDQVQVDERLRGIVQRAVARDLSLRYPDARALRDALQQWLQPVAAPPGLAPGDPAALEFLLRRMRHKTDFPALSDSVMRIQRVAASDSESLRSLVDAIQRDVALTAKLLRMVNTVHFLAVSGQPITTLTRAVALVGFAGIRNMALSVLLFEHMGDKGHAAQLKEEFLRALMAATLSAELAGNGRDGEEAYLAALFQNLGRLLVEFYFPEEAQQIRRQLPAGADAVARNAAARRELGLSLVELGAGVARAWTLPEALQQALRLAEEAEPPQHAPASAGERLCWLARGANRISDALLAADGEAQEQALLHEAERHAAVLGRAPRDLAAAARLAQGRLASLVQAMGLQVTPQSPARRLLGQTLSLPACSVDLSRAAAPGELRAAEASTQQLAQQRHARLQQGLLELRRLIAQRRPPLNEVLQRVLETLHVALEFRCTVLALRESASGAIVGRVGLGAGADAVVQALRVVPDGGSGELFPVLCARGVDLLVSNTNTMAARLPAWYRQRVAAGTFVLLPLQLGGRPLGLIYADKLQAGSLDLGEAERGLLRELRDIAVEAFVRQGA